MDRNTRWYRPIREKVEEWIWYYDHRPKSNYFENREEHDTFRSRHDRECMLTGGELKADMLFDLWTPLKETIIRLNDEETIQLVGDISRKYDFLREFVQYDCIEYLLPMNKSPVWALSMLFGLGMGRGNVFVLPDRKLKCARAKKPYYNYMPAFLLESFPGGTLADYWDSVDDYLQWIHREHLEMFFDGEISPENIRDLSGSGDVRVSRVPEGIYAMGRMLNRYCNVLMKREKIFRDLDGAPQDGLLYPWIQEMSEEEIDSMYRTDENLLWEREMREKDPDRARRANEKMDKFVANIEAKFPELLNIYSWAKD